MAKNPRYISYALLFLFLLSLSGCTGDNSGEKNGAQKKYSIYAMMKDGNEYIVQTDSIVSGSLNPALQGTKLPLKDMWSDLIVRDGYYYRLNWKTETFIKYQIENEEFKEVASTKLTDFSFLETYTWTAPDTILLITYNRKSGFVRFAKLNTKTMDVREGKLAIPSPSGIYNWMSLGFAELRAGKLFVGYTYHTINKNENYTTSDTAYVAVLKFPGLTLLKTSKDTRSTYPGGINTEQPFTFADEKGDMYFIACPGIALGNNPKKPTGIFRIKKSEDTIDPEYFFNISTSPIQNHGYGLWYLGDGKAIVRTERKIIFTGMKDHYKVPHFDFFVIDLKTKSTAKLNLPLDKGSARQCVILEDDLAYITTNSDREGSFVWVYNSEKNKLEKGLQFSGNVDYILRIDQLH
jgi:hypothetical protein